VVEHHGTGTDQTLVLEGAPLEVDEVTDDAAVAYTGGKTRSGMDDGAVLYGRAAADGDLAVVAA
jgi:hypothetical protein